MLAERLQKGFSLYRERLAAAQEGRMCEHDRAKKPKRDTVPPIPSDRGRDITFKVCSIASYFIIVGMAFAVHPLAGLLFLWLGFYIAPIAASAAIALFMVALPFFILGLFIIAGIALYVIYG